MHTDSYSYYLTTIANYLIYHCHIPSVHVHVHADITSVAILYYNYICRYAYNILYVCTDAHMHTNACTHHDYARLHVCNVSVLHSLDNS